jgi:enoyl-CoA hydratase/carnithine racemase
MNRPFSTNLTAAWCRNAIVCLAATTATLFLATASRAQGGNTATPPANPPRETILRPGDELRQPLGTDKSRAEVVRTLEELIVQRDLKGQIIEELKKNHFDGTPQSAIRIAAVDLSLSRDEAVAYGLVTKAVEDHKFQVWRLLSGRRSKLAECERNRDARAKDVESLADQIARGQDDTGVALTAAQIDDLRNLLYMKILHRKDLDERCRRLGVDCDFYKGEIASLNTLDERVEGMAKLAAVHVERHMDAVQSEQEALIAADVKAGQEDLRKMIDIVRACRPPDSQLPTTVDNSVESRGAPIESAIAQLKRELPPEAQKLIDEEVQKAQARVTPAQAEQDQEP